MCLRSRTVQTDALNRQTKYEHDQRGRRTKRTLPLNQFEVYGYDPVGNLTTRTDFNGKVTIYTYDAANRLLSKTPDASFGVAPVTFTYHAEGQRHTMTDAHGTTTSSYNAQDRLLQKITPDGTLNYQYDFHGNVTSISSPTGTVNYTYDALNRLKTVANTLTGTTTYNYDANGNLADVTAPNGVKHAYTYNAKNQLTNLGVTDTAAVTLKSYAYTLAPSGHRLSVAELSGRNVAYTYDNLWRLTSETIAGDTAATPQNGVISYTYDAVGNRQSRASTVPAIAAITPGMLLYDANDRFTGPTADVYDANGNTVGSAGFNVTYDFENRIIKREDPTVANDDIIIVYDGDGHRVEKRVQTGPSTFTVTRYLVDELNPTGYAQVLVETVVGQLASRNYVYGLDLISQRRQVNTTTFETRYFGYDGHGSTRFLTDGAGTVTDTFDYDAFGNLISSTGSTPNHYLYAGEQFDSDLGLYYNRARYLDVRTGRFWSMDTYEGDPDAPVSLHKYLYAHSDGINNVDPTGRFTLAESIQVQGSIMKLTSISLRLLRTLEFVTAVTDAIDATVSVLNLLQSPAWSSQLAQAFQSSLVGFKPSEATESLQRNFSRIIALSAGPWSQWLIRYGSKVKGLLLYLPNPGGIPQLAPIKTGIKIARKPVYAVVGGRDFAGRVIGVGFFGGRPPGVHQVWRMDYHPFHKRPVRKDEIALWADPPFHYHVLRPSL